MQLDRAGGNYFAGLSAAIGWRGSQTIVAHCLNRAATPPGLLRTNVGRIGGRT